MPHPIIKAKLAVADFNTAAIKFLHQRHICIKQRQLVIISGVTIKHLHLLLLIGMGCVWPKQMCPSTIFKFLQLLIYPANHPWNFRLASGKAISFMSSLCKLHKSTDTLTYQRHQAFSWVRYCLRDCVLVGPPTQVHLG